MNEFMDLTEMIRGMAREAKRSARRLRSARSSQKDAALRFMAEGIVARKEEIGKINAEDVSLARQKGLSSAMIDRLTLDEKTIASMVAGLQEVITLPDPIGEVTGMWKRPNGLQVGRLKSGNAVILKGGSEAINSNLILNEILGGAVEKAGLPGKSIQVVPSTEHEAVGILLGLDDCVDMIIPRGGEGLIRFVAENSRIPVLKHYKGVCHVYVDEFADIDMARTICFNAKVQRPGVCNAMETMLVHQKVASSFLPEMIREFMSAGVEIRGCKESLKLIPGLKQAEEADWPAEFLDLVLAVKVVETMDEALDHIEKYGSNHTEAIVTQNYERSQEFLQRVDASVVLVNASTRFNDGFELGLGAEIGINTAKLHAYGPMSLKELTATKFIVFGSGQVRT
jgi:glutamate-5-semialdehyde dehydrogenase